MEDTAAAAAAPETEPAPETEAAPETGAMPQEVEESAPAHDDAEAEAEGECGENEAEELSDKKGLKSKKSKKGRMWSTVNTVDFYNPAPYVPAKGGKSDGKGAGKGLGKGEGYGYGKGKEGAKARGPRVEGAGGQPRGPPGERGPPSAVPGAEPGIGGSGAGGAAARNHEALVPGAPDGAASAPTGACTEMEAGAGDIASPDRGGKGRGGQRGGQQKAFGEGGGASGGPGAAAAFGGGDRGCGGGERGKGKAGDRGGGPKGDRKARCGGGGGGVGGGGCGGGGGGKGRGGGGEAGEAVYGGLGPPMEQMPRGMPGAGGMHRPPMNAAPMVGLGVNFKGGPSGGIPGISSGMPLGMPGMGGGLKGGLAPRPMMPFAGGPAGFMPPYAYGGMPGALGTPMAMYMPYIMMAPGGGFGMPGGLGPGPPMPMLPGGLGTPLGAPGAPMPPAMVMPSQDPGALKAQVLAQLEYYFSQDNMLKDLYLRTQMNEEGWVAIALLANFAKLRSLTTDSNMILEALAASKVIELDEKSHNVRVKSGWQKWILPTTSNALPEEAGKDGPSRDWKAERHSVGSRHEAHVTARP